MTVILLSAKHILHCAPFTDDSNLVVKSFTVFLSINVKEVPSTQDIGRKK